MMNQFSIESAYLVYTLTIFEEVDSMAVGMITNNKMEHVLPISFHQIDSQRYFRYNISSKVSLQKYLVGTLDKNRVFNMFRSICEAYTLMDEFLLDSAAFILDPRYLFVEPATGEVSLVYLATTEERNEPDMMGFFKRLLISIKPELSDGCANLIGAILTYLNSSDHFSFEEFMRVLQQQGKASLDMHPQSRKVHAPTMPRQVQKVEPQSLGTTKQPVQPTSKKEHQTDIVNPKEKPQQILQVPRESSQKREGMQPTATKSHSFEVPNGKKVVEKPSSPTQIECESEEIKLGWLLHNFSGENLAKYRAQKKKQSTNEESAGKKDKKRKKKKEDYVLILSSTNPKFPIQWIIDQDEFVIGRSKNNNHGVLSGISNNISRTHCKVVRKDGLYYVVDLNSTYGTSLDGVRCKGNVDYKNESEMPTIREGSILELPTISFKATLSERKNG